MNDVDVFRKETREWLELNCPASMRKPLKSEKDQCWGGRKGTFQSEDQRLWMEGMAERGWSSVISAPAFWRKSAAAARQEYGDEYYHSNRFATLRGY